MVTYDTGPTSHGTRCTMSKLLKLIPLTLQVANDFVTKYHRHNKRCVGCKFCLGATYNGELVGVAIVGRPVARKLADPLVMEVNRNCVSPEAPKGTCSFLYSRAMKVWQSMGGKKLITYTLETESGASLRATNFKQKAVTQPFKKGTGWTTRKGREWQKVQLIPRIRWEWKV